MAGPDVDVVIAGAGAAGLVAALAIGNDADVLLVEASETFASDNTAMSTAMIPAAGTRWQEASGVDDSPPRFLADIEAKTGGQVYRPLAQALTQISAELVEWLGGDWGMPIELVKTFSIRVSRFIAAIRCMTGRAARSTASCSTASGRSRTSHWLFR